MKRMLQQEAQRLAYISLGALFLGWLSNHMAAVLLGFLLLYGLLHCYQLGRLVTWLHRDGTADVPEARGLWGDIFQRIYQLRRDEERARQNLVGIIERARASVSALHEAVVLIDSHGNLEWWNPAAETLLGLKMQTDKGQAVTNFVRDPAFIEFFEQGRQSDSLQLPSALHEGQFLQFSLTRFGRNDRLMIVRDISRLQALEVMRRDFVANVSHELRTPLTVLTGYLETLHDQSDLLPPRLQRALTQMTEQSRRMTALVQDLLLLSRLEGDSQKQPAQAVDVPALLAQLANEARVLAQQKQQHISLECPEKGSLLGHAEELRSAFTNLVSNALRYTPAGGHIQLRWQRHEQGACFSVQDDGIGIEAVHLPRLTERFYRVDAARSSASGGTGLGLAIVKHVLLEHEARLEIQSQPGQGSIFRCIFPPQRLQSAE